MSADALREVNETLYSAASALGRPAPVLVAVSKHQPATAIAELAAAGQVAFAENYVQEALRKQRELAESGLAQAAVWHLIGHVQSNKAKEAAQAFDWVQTVDRLSLAEALERHRPVERGPLNVLIQVNIDGEAGKHGCRPDEAAALAAFVGTAPNLALRGLMVIPTPHAELEARRPAFRAARQLFDDLQSMHPEIDTLSMGMSEDFVLAVGEGATMIRIGTALFGARPSPPEG